MLSKDCKLILNYLIITDCYTFMHSWRFYINHKKRKESDYRVFGTPQLHERQFWHEGIKQQWKKTSSKEVFQLQFITRLLLRYVISSHLRIGFKQLERNIANTSVDAADRSTTLESLQHTQAVLLWLCHMFSVSVSLTFLVRNSTNQTAIRDLLSH